MFGPNVGFVDLVVDAELKHVKKRIPGILFYTIIYKFTHIYIFDFLGYVFLRGKSVGVLVIVNKNKMLLVR